MQRIEYVLWGTPKGSSDAIDEKVLYTQGKNVADLERIKLAAAKDGWHSFRIQTLDLNIAPDFSSNAQNQILNMD